MEWPYTVVKKYYSSNETYNYTLDVQAGFDASNGVDYYVINGSFTGDITNINKQSNVGQPGMFVFQVNGPEIPSIG